MLVRAFRAFRAFRACHYGGEKDREDFPYEWAAEHGQTREEISLGKSVTFQILNTLLPRSLLQMWKFNTWTERERERLREREKEKERERERMKERGRGREGGRERGPRESEGTREQFTDSAEDSIQSDSKTCGNILVVLSWILVIMTMPFSLFVCFKVVQEYERAVIFRLGRLLSGGAKGPGIFFILPCVDNYARVDLRTRTYDVPPQEVLTKDSVTVSVDAVVYYRVNNATISIANVENAHHSTRLLAQTTLRNTMGTRPLHEILSERETISGNMQISLDEATDTWGIKVERVEIKDVRLPVQLQRAMAAEAEAAREARAKVIAAEGEQKASRALREASEVIGDSPAALQLRYLQTLNTISAEKNSTIVFPLPIDMLTYFMKAREMS
ncbi:band 7 protein AGAP004871 isoform X1 [Vespa mandarinia]|uniref:band 7 protein AGAP004871 isoform X1 n=2 Tax=Vespa TaxID=7443 RepID=UPI00161DB189|nr:band 7 protein AGAP004871 isoform X1 [Vespa mandarinia]